jgi:hypothetical protein
MAVTKLGYMLEPPVNLAVLVRCHTLFVGWNDEQ